jgi:miniconductance mechanosensitive channel
MDLFEYLHKKINLIFEIPVDSNLLSIFVFITSFIFLSLFYKFFNYIIIGNFRNWFVTRSQKYGNLLIKNNLISRFIKLIFAALLSKISLNLPNESVSEYTYLITNLFMIFFTSGMIFSFLDAVFDFFKTKKSTEVIPLQAIVQVVKLFIVVASIIFAISSVLDKSPLILLSGIGAFSAVLMLVFKDSILNLVAIFQIRLQQSIGVGDWIEMSNYGVDGDVSEINLSGIEVVNFDKTTTIIPPSAFLTNSFKNYKTMSTTSRRIKRSFYIDINTISFLSSEKINELMAIPILKNYLDEKNKEIEKLNAGMNKNDTLFKGKAITNIGTFRKYIEEYLLNNVNISKNETLLVRQLAASDRGLPIELYCFTSNTNWIHFEKVQSDIFDHLFSVADVFGLKAFQYPSGNDLIDTLSSLKNQTS